jgi:hypothetical protein
MSTFTLPNPAKRALSPHQPLAVLAQPPHLSRADSTASLSRHLQVDLDFTADTPAGSGSATPSFSVGGSDNDGREGKRRKVDPLELGQAVKKAAGEVLDLTFDDSEPEEEAPIVAVGKTRSGRVSVGGGEGKREKKAKKEKKKDRKGKGKAKEVEEDEEEVQEESDDEIVILEEGNKTVGWWFGDKQEAEKRREAFLYVSTPPDRSGEPC